MAMAWNASLSIQTGSSVNSIHIRFRCIGTETENDYSKCVTDGRSVKLALAISSWQPQVCELLPRPTVNEVKCIVQLLDKMLPDGFDQQLLEGVLAHVTALAAIKVAFRKVLRRLDRLPLGARC